MLLAVDEFVGCEKVVLALCMNKAMVVFVRKWELVLIEDGTKVSEGLYSVTLLCEAFNVPVSNIPPFIPNEDIEWELSDVGKIVNSVRVVIPNYTTLH